MANKKLLNEDALVAVYDILPKKRLIGTFNTSSFTYSGGNYSLNNISLNLNGGYIANSDMLIITWGNCFALCPVPTSGAGRVCAAMWNANGESQVIRIKYELKSSNTKLDIALSGGFTPPSNFTAYIQCMKIFG